jgi:hypothetical protein
MRRKIAKIMFVQPCHCKEVQKCRNTACRLPISTVLLPDFFALVNWFTDTKGVRNVGY